MVGFELKEGWLYFPVLVAPRASKSTIVGEHDGMIKVRIAAPPVDGSANKELISLFSKELKVPRSGIELVSGEASKRKTLRVRATEAEKLMRVLEAKI